MVFTSYFSQLSSPSNMNIGVSSKQNSRINCLHIPHGLAGGLTSLLTATARTSGIAGRAKLATSAARAQRSAHVPTGVDATSTLAPAKRVCVLPGAGAAMRTLAPTRKLLYGQ